jgi:uncharacterized membrane protein
MIAGLIIGLIAGAALGLIVGIWVVCLLFTGAEDLPHAGRAPVFNPQNAFSILK